MGRSATTRLVVIVCGVLLLATALAATARSSSNPLDATRWGEDAHSTPAAAAPSHTPAVRVLYRSDFRSDPIGANPPAGWAKVDGGWQGVTSDGNRVVRHAPGPSYGHLVIGSPTWSNYRVEADVKATPLATGFAGIVGRYQSTGDYYECVIHHAVAMQLWRIRHDQGMELGGTELPVDTTRFHRVTLEMKGPRLTCSMDGVTSVTILDGSLAAGRVGLVASDGEEAEFDNVRVTAG